MTNIKSKIRVVIIDDEEVCSNSLTLLLKNEFPEIVLLGIGKSVQEGISLINHLMPDLVFLDIALPDGNGFDILEQTSFKNFEVIFTTSFNDFAIQAFEFSALHYLLKPITLQKVKSAIQRYNNFKTFDGIDYKLNTLKDILNNKNDNIVLSTLQGFSLFNISDIIRCEADTQYTNVFFNDGNVLVISKNLNIFESILKSHSFLRIHKSHLVNMKYFKKYVKIKPSYMVLKDNSEIPISDRSKPLLLDFISGFADKI
jgi:two-component system LytT family response regulator